MIWEDTDERSGGVKQQKPPFSIRRRKGGVIL